MALDIADLAPILLNGPIEVGLAAAAADAGTADKVLDIFPKLEDTVAHVPVPAGATPEMIRHLQVAAAMITGRLWHKYGDAIDANVVVHAADPAAAGANPVGREFFASITVAEVRAIITIVSAAKVTFWNTNHHLGGPRVVGMVLRAMAILLGDRAADTEGWRWVVHAISHWASTKGFLRAFGVTDIADPVAGVYDAADWPVPTDDIVLRIASGPAGAAKVTTHAAVLRQAIRSPFGIALDPSEEYKAIFDEEEKLETAVDGRGRVADGFWSATHHIGARYLTGRAQVGANAVGETAATNLACWVHAVKPGSTLAKAGVIKKINEVQGEAVYNRIVALRARALNAIPEGALASAVDDIIGGSGSSNPLAAAAAHAGIRVDDIDAAIAKAKAAVAAP